MKIVHITKKYPNALGGDAIGSYNLRLEQERAGHEVYIITTNSLEIIEDEKVLKFGVPSKAEDWDTINFKRLVSSIALLFNSFRILKRLKPDIVHSHSADLGYLLSFACRLYKIPVVNQCRGVSFPYKENVWIKRVIELACLKHGNFKKILTVDENSLVHFQKKNIQNVQFIHNGVNLNNYSSIKKPNNKVHFLFVGRFELQKGLNYLVDAVELLAKHTQEFHLFMIGTGSQENHIQQRIKEKALDNFITLLGSKNSDDVAKVYKDSDVFILTSIWEGFPLTLLEAWATSLPVIVTSVGGISKICTDQENSLLIKPTSAQEASNAMYTLVKNPALRLKLGTNGRKLVERKYSWKSVSELLLNIYDEVRM